MTLGLTDTSPGPAGEVTRDTTWPRRVTVTCHACHACHVTTSEGWHAVM